MDSKRITKKYNPRFVMSIHGIFSKGKWQDNLSNVLDDLGLVSLAFKYNSFILPREKVIDKRVKEFKDWYFAQVDLYRDIDINLPFYRPSIVAHSLGTWIVAKAIQRYPEIKFDKIFLHGSIIPSDFNWFELIQKDQVCRVVTEVSQKDWVVKWGFFVTKERRPCGRYGFNQKTRFLKQISVANFEHSDTHYRARFESQLKEYLFDPPVQLKVVHGIDLNMKSLVRNFQDTLLIDQQAFGIDYINGRPVTIELAKSWAEVEPDIWSFIVNTFSRKVVGYINTMGVDDETMTAFVKGEIGETDINESQIRRFDYGQTLNIIVLSIALCKDLRELEGGVLASIPGELLLITLAQKLVSISQRGPKIKQIACVAWTNAGESLCKHFGMTNTGNKYLGHSIYSITAEQLILITKKDTSIILWWYMQQIKMNLSMPSTKN